MRGVLKNLVCGLLLLILLCAVPGNVRCAPADKMVDATEGSLGQIVDHLLGGSSDHATRIDELERAANVFREQKSKFETGSWKLPVFYSAIAVHMASTSNQHLLAEWQQRHPDSATPYIIEYQQRLGQMLSGSSAALDSLESTSQAFIARPDEVAAFRQDLIANKAKVSVDPEWYVVMARLSLISERDEASFTKLILEAIKREPTYWGHYDAAADYFLPKWGGSSAAVERWARMASSETADVKGIDAYARTYFRAIKTQYGNSVFQTSRIDWLDFKSDATRIVAEYPSLRNVNMFTMAACLAGDHDETKRLVDLNPKSLRLGEVLGTEDRESCLLWARTPLWYIRLKSSLEWLWSLLLAYFDLRFGPVPA